MEIASNKPFEDMLDYLPAEEGIVGRHKIGGHDIVTTTERVICMRRFPPLFVGIRYDEIDNLEHRTTIMWNELANGIALLAVAAVAYYKEASGGLASLVNGFLQRYLKELADMFPATVMVPVFIWLAAAAGLYHIIRFLPSLSGYFRISRRDRAPIIIPARMTPQLGSLMREIEGLMRQRSMVPQRPAAPEERPPEEPADLAAYVRDRLKVAFKGMGSNNVILVSSKSENHEYVVSNLLDILVKERGMGGVYISVTRPYDFVASKMEALSIPSSDVYFIDCISMMAGKTHQSGNQNVAFIENPSSLEEVSMYLDKMLAKVRNQKRFIIMDSLSSLLIYNTDKTVKEFTHYLINKVRLDNIEGVILSIEKKEAEELVKTLTPMCDVEMRF